MNGFVHRFAYPCPVRLAYNPKIHQMRDGAAFGEIFQALVERGWKYRTLLCNYPYREGNGDILMGPEYFRFLSQEDCIVQTTRLPLHDHLTTNRKRIQRSHSHLEEAVFDAASGFFDFLCREQVRLVPSLVERAATAAGVSIDEFPARYHFRQHHDARISEIGYLDETKRTTKRKPKDYRSLGFFIHAPAIRDYGCRLICSFGMGGFETLVWNRVCRVNRPEWLDRPCFVMAEMDLNGIPDHPITPDFADQVPVRVLIKERIEERPRETCED